VGLTKEEAEEAKRLLWNDYAGMIRETRRAEMDGKAIRIGDHEMKFEIVRFEEKAMIPEGGRSLRHPDLPPPEDCGLADRRAETK